MDKVSKSGPLSKTDLEFLGYSKVVLNEDPAAFGLPNRCRIFDAEAAAGIGKVRHWFIYLLSDCTNDDLEQVESGLKSDLFKGEECYIVVPESLSGRKAIKQIKQNIIRLRYPFSVRVFEEMMWGEIRQKFDPYMQEEGNRMEDLKADIPYIEPSLTKEKNSQINTPRNYFTDFFSGKSEDDSGMSVIKAEAGVGKTTLAVMIANELVQKWEQSRVIPILLNGEEWRDLAEQLHAQGVISLWNVLLQALNSKRKSFPLSVNDRDEALFIRIMQQGYIAFIFDSFDELRDMSLSPKDNFEWLGDIAKDSSARIMVTARTSFWDREIEDPNTPHQTFKLMPFSRDNVRNYFKKHFGEEKEAMLGEAMQIYSQLASQFDQTPSRTGNANFPFVNLPACAAMIADHVESGGKVSTPSNSENMIDEFLSVILHRERERQGIVIDIEKTRNVFEEVAIYNAEFTMEDLEIFGPPGLQKDDLAKIRDHAFLSRVPGKQTETYRFKHEFLLHYLRASRILARMNQGGQIFVEKEYKGDLFKRIRSEADGKGHLSDQMANFADENKLQQIAEAHKICTDDKLKSFFFHVIAKSAALRSHGKSRGDRAEEIFKRLGAQGKEISSLCIEGSIANLSLRGWTILDSNFVNLAFVRCETDGLNFVSCHFAGNLELPDGARPFFKNCKGKDGAKLVINETDHRGDITEADIRDYLKKVLQRFYQRNHFKGITPRNWSKGVTRDIERRFNLLDSMKHNGLLEETPHYKNLKIAPDHIGEVRDFIDNGRLKGAVRAVFDGMKNTIGID